ncbi:MAG TPA: hypothetical protein VL285_18260 [Bryobacteraceae bacterium]|nr:hypothetical protein [Bryobacteraceae bacterium]
MGFPRHSNGLEEALEELGITIGSALLRTSAERAAGAALWAGQRYVHLCAFARQGNGGGVFSTRVARPALRRQS